MNKTKEWLVRINGAEGGYSNRSPLDDPGGETKWGIPKRSYPDLDIKNLSLEVAAKIYAADFIVPLTNKFLPDSITFQLLDFAVHSGISRAIKCLQKELGLPADGIAGTQTRGAILATSESDLAMRILAARLDYLTSLDNWLSNSKGWTRRIAKNLRYGAEDTD